MNKYLEAQKQLAELLGWHRFYFVGGDLCGDRPSDNIVESSVPDWHYDSAAVFDLMVEHELNVEWDEDCVIVYHYHSPCSYFKKNQFVDFKDTEAVVRVAIVQAVIAKLKGK